MMKTYSRDGDFVNKKISFGEKEITLSPSSPFRYINISFTDGQMINDGTDTETVTVEVVNGLEVVRGSDPSNATVLDYDGDVTVTIDGVETTKTLSNGTVSFDLTTDKPAGSTIEIVAESLTDHPAKSDSAEIEVVNQ